MFKGLNYQNVKNGNLDYCQISGKKDLEEVVDLGLQPLCDTLLNEEDLKKNTEKFYPLKLLRSKNLGHAQLSYIVPQTEVYHPNYPYRPGITKEIQIHHSDQADENIKNLKLLKNDLVVDIGSNDGTLLNEYRSRGMIVTGIEPTNTADIANKSNIFTIKEPFTSISAKKIINKNGKAKLITATNVFAHMSTLYDVMCGILTLMEKKSYFILENHYIMDIIENNQYDSIYHEHIRNYSLSSLKYLFELYNLKIVNASIIDRYKGSIKVTVTNDKHHKVNENVNKIIQREKIKGLFQHNIWDNFRDNIKKSKKNLLKILESLKKDGKSVVANSCPGRSSTLMNYCNIGKELIPYIAEQPSSLKLGKYLPGKHIPVINNEILFKEQPDYILQLAWHLADPIIKNLRSRGIKSKFIIPLPQPKIIS